MKPVKFKERNATIAKDQHEYNNLPAHIEDGVVTSCWSLSWKERFKVLF